MSRIYIARLRGISDELDTARSALRFIAAQWHRSEVQEAFALQCQTQINAAADGLEVAYFVRLTAEFENILKDHLRSNHPSVTFPASKANWKLDWFLSRVIQREALTLSPELRARLDAVRDYRNTLAHGDPPVAPLTFTDALRVYNVFLAKLPEPFA